MEIKNRQVYRKLSSCNWCEYYEGKPEPHCSLGIEIETKKVYRDTTKSKAVDAEACRLKRKEVGDALRNR